MSAAPAFDIDTLPTYQFVGADGAPTVLALGGISADCHVVSHLRDSTPGWWQGLGGAGRVLDLERRRVLGVTLRDGGCADDGRPARIVTTHDQAASIVALLDELRWHADGQVLR